MGQCFFPFTAFTYFYGDGFAVAGAAGAVTGMPGNFVAGNSLYSLFFINTDVPGGSSAVSGVGQPGPLVAGRRAGVAGRVYSYIFRGQV